jgi:hypothetical protein
MFSSPSMITIIVLQSFTVSISHNAGMMPSWHKYTMWPTSPPEVILVMAQQASF